MWLLYWCYETLICHKGGLWLIKLTTGDESSYTRGLTRFTQEYNLLMWGQQKRVEEILINNNNTPKSNVKHIIKKHKSNIRIFKRKQWFRYVGVTKLVKHKSEVLFNSITNLFLKKHFGEFRQKWGSILCSSRLQTNRKPYGMKF